MYTHWTFNHGGNPYITTTNTKLFELICKYCFAQESERGFYAIEERPWNIGKDTTRAEIREAKKALLRAFAIDWQASFNNFRYCWDDLADWGDFFTEMGRKYGLLREFRENGIC